MLSDDTFVSTQVQVMPISPGLAIGPVRLYRAKGRAVELTKLGADQLEAELLHLQRAIDAAIVELRVLAEHVARTVGRNEADIFEAQELMLQDPELLEEVNGLMMREQYSGVSALHEVAEEQARQLEELENETLAARAADLRDVVARVIRHLQSEERVPLSSGVDASPVLVVAYDLTPSDTATFDPQSILGICTVVGGPTTHAAILARALGIPAVAGLDAHLLETLRDGQQIAIDGAKGIIYVHPDAVQRQALQDQMRQQRQTRELRRTQNESMWRNRPASTADGHVVRIFANVGDVESARAAAMSGAEGIGLLRTEFLFGGRQFFPNEQEQFESYFDVFRAFAGRAEPGTIIVARTLDAGADKPFPALEPLLGPMQEANPALGLRGARIHLVHEGLLRQQLRALLRAGSATAIDLHIMFPMIATVEEVRRLRAVAADVRAELEREGVVLAPNTQFGIMVETPAAALMADVLAREVDFFSIGANDLYQYTMAVDRTNSRVAGMFGLLEPAVWRLIEWIVQAGNVHGKSVALCGELAADPRIGPLLVGLGVRELSMSPPAIANVKAALYRHTLPYWQQRAQELLHAETSSDVQTALDALDE